MKPIKTLMLALLVSFGGTVHAQALAGVRGVNIVVENLTDNASKCGITKNLLDAAVRLPLSNSRITIVNGASQYLYVSAVFLVQSSSSCAAVYSLSFNKFVPSEKDTGEFWREGGIITGNPEYVSRNISNNLESFTKQFIAAWLKANPQ
jgi:hypothetical protein